MFLRKTAILVLTSALCASTTLSAAAPSKSKPQLGKLPTKPPTQQPKLSVTRSSSRLGFSNSDFRRFKDNFEKYFAAFEKKHPSPRAESVREPDSLKNLYALTSEQFETMINMATYVRNEDKAQTITLFERLKLYGALRPILMEKALDMLIAYSAHQSLSRRRQYLKASANNLKTRLLSASSKLEHNIKDIHDMIFRFITLLDEIIVPALTRSKWGTLKKMMGYKGMVGTTLGGIAAIMIAWKSKQIAEAGARAVVTPFEKYIRTGKGGKEVDVGERIVEFVSPIKPKKGETLTEKQRRSALYRTFEQKAEFAENEKAKLRKHIKILKGVKGVAAITAEEKELAALTGTDKAKRLRDKEITLDSYVIPMEQRAVSQAIREGVPLILQHPEQAGRLIKTVFGIGEKQKETAE